MSQEVLIDTLQQTNQPDEPQQRTLDDFKDLLPKETLEKLVQIERHLSEGKPAEALLVIQDIREEFMAPSKYWYYDTPTNLQVEDTIRKMKRARDEEESQRENVTFCKFFVDPAAKMADFYVDKITRR